jgi:hypothetical protein
VKRLLSLVLVSSIVFLPTSFAAAKKPVVKPLKFLTTIGTPEEFGGVVTSAKIIIEYGNHGASSFARGIDIKGNELWNLNLDELSPSIATAATVDSNGTVWIAGSTSLTRPTPTPSPTVLPLDPDKVVAVPDIYSADLDAFSLWSINPVSQAMSQYSLQLKAPILINAIVVDKIGISAVGSSGTLISADLSGHIANPIALATDATSFESIVRNPDGTKTIVGSSSETLGGKKLVGKVDGVIVKVSKANKVISVVRSSATKSIRNWTSASSTFLLGGSVVTGAKIESAITKFSSAYVPTWTYRFSSTGETFTAGSSFALFQSTSAITQLTGWSPKNPRALLIGFDAKGAVNAGYSAPTTQQRVLGLYASLELGILCITSSADSVSIFTLN